MKLPETYNELMDYFKKVNIIIQRGKVVPYIKEGPVLFVGDIHGFYKNFIDALTLARMKKVKNLVFLGDYVDRGDYQLETLINILYLYTRSLINTINSTLEKKDNPLNNDIFKRPEFIDERVPDNFSFNVIMLRGNHEDLYMNSRYGFVEILSEKYGYDLALKKEITTLYNNLPLMVITQWKTIALHGGLPKISKIDNYNKILNTLKNLKFPLNYNFDFNDMSLYEDSEKFDLKKFIMQILWNDPTTQQDGDDKNNLFLMNFRGPGIYQFREDALNIFLKETKLKRMVRAHESVRGAYEVLWGAKLIHIFSAYPYFGALQTPAFYLEDDRGKGEILNEKGKILKRIE